MILTRHELKAKLRKDRDFWFAKELAECFGVTTRTIQRTAKRCCIGKKVRHGPRGTYVFQVQDFPKMCEEIHGEVGNPVNIAKSRKGKDV